MENVVQFVKSNASDDVQVLDRNRQIPFSTGQYRVEEVRISESACIFFAHCNDPQQQETQRRVVIKVLRQYKDNRYNLATLQDRQRCQLEALRINQKFTDGIYCGLESIYPPPNKNIWDCQTNDVVDIKTINRNSEYALIMEALPAKCRLDHLLSRLLERSTLSGAEVIKQYLDVLIQRIIFLHNDDISQPLSANDHDSYGYQWGSPQQIQTKLKHNFKLYDLIAKIDKGLYTEYRGIKQDLHDIAIHPLFRKYLMQRIEESQIKHCHGDLKVTNIWLDDSEQDVQDKVFILDAIDFNASYSNIDTLSDLAMLVVDIETYTGEKQMASDLIQKYLSYTKAVGMEAAQGVLQYYLAEKALVRAAVSLYFDSKNSELPFDAGRTFLKIASRNVDELKHALSLQKSSFPGMQRLSSSFYSSLRPKPIG